MWRSCTSTTPGARASRSPTARVSIPLGAASSRIAVESRRIDHELTRTSTPMSTLTRGSASSQPVARMTIADSDDPDRAEQVRENVSKRSLDVQAVLARPGEDESGCEIDGDSDDAQDENPASEHVRRVAKPLERLVEDPDRERDERDAVRERCQHLRPLVAVGSLRARGSAGEPDGEEGKRERDVVGQHVHRVCEQCQAAGDEPADDLGDRVESGDRECERECAATAGPRVRVVVTHIRVLPARHDRGALFRNSSPSRVGTPRRQGIIQRCARSSLRSLPSSHSRPPWSSSLRRERPRTACRPTRTAGRSGHGSTRSRSPTQDRSRARTPA